MSIRSDAVWLSAVCPWILAAIMIGYAGREPSPARSKQDCNCQCIKTQKESVTIQ